MNSAPSNPSTSAQNESPPYASPDSPDMEEEEEEVEISDSDRSAQKSKHTEATWLAVHQFQSTVDDNEASYLEHGHLEERIKRLEEKASKVIHQMHLISDYITKSTQVNDFTMNFIDYLVKRINKLEGKFEYVNTRSQFESGTDTTRINRHIDEHYSTLDRRIINIEARVSGFVKAFETMATARQIGQQNQLVMMPTMAHYGP